MPDQNPLFPAFLKLENLRVLLVGGGNVGLEKLTAILRSSPKAQATIVSLTFLPELRARVSSSSSAAGSKLTSTPPTSSSPPPTTRPCTAASRQRPAPAACL
jgi:hypothetical protein